MKTFDAVILTDARYVNPEKMDGYIENVLLEDNILRTALENAGLKVGRVNWDHPGFDWASTQYVIFRSTWDYFYRFDEFSVWLEKTRSLTSMINPYRIIQWNLDKHYLLDFQKEGINIPPTLAIEPGDARSLSEIGLSTGWKEMILKPAISGGARHTYRLNSENIHKHETLYHELILRESMLLQEFQDSVIPEGEIALMVFGGRFSHAVLKLAREGDFRVQDDFGGTVHDYAASSPEVDFAEKVVSVCDPLPVYARVDVIRDNSGKLCLSELELIEPELWFRNCPEAAEMFAESFINYIQSEPDQI